MILHLWASKAQQVRVTYVVVRSSGLRGCAIVGVLSTMNSLADSLHTNCEGGHRISVRKPRNRRQDGLHFVFVARELTQKDLLPNSSQQVQDKNTFCESKCCFRWGHFSKLFYVDRSLLLRTCDFECRSLYFIKIIHQKRVFWFFCSPGRGARSAPFTVDASSGRRSEDAGGGVVGFVIWI